MLRPMRLEVLSVARIRAPLSETLRRTMICSLGGVCEMAIRQDKWVWSTCSSTTRHLPGLSSCASPFLSSSHPRSEKVRIKSSLNDEARGTVRTSHMRTTESGNPSRPFCDSERSPNATRLVFVYRPETCRCLFTERSRLDAFRGVGHDRMLGHVYSLFGGCSAFPSYSISSLSP